MKTCMRCGKEYDPSMEFVEPAEDMEMLLAVDDRTEDCCPDCCWELTDKIHTATNCFFTEL